MATSEIEKLERRYAENPQGLTFAPLAEVHRKNGDVTRALELLTAGLELHPNYIPASIVLGRCHQDLGDLSAAEAAFAHVLRLDDENVIALKSLADINERLERYGDAESWLRRLVSVDRSNDEAREQLRRLETIRNDGKQGSGGSTVPAVPEAPLDLAAEGAAKSATQGEERPKRPSAEVVALDLPPIDIAALDAGKPAPGPAPVRDAVPPNAPAEAAPLVLDRTPELSELKSEKVPSITDAPPAADADAVQPVLGLQSQEFEPPREHVSPPLEFLAIDVETSEEVVLEGSGGSEYRVPDAAEDFRESMSAPSQASKPDAVKETPFEASKAAVETRKATPKAAAYTARDTKGQSVAAFFRTMLAARPPESDSPARPVQEGLSLNSVIGQERPAAPPAGGEGSQAKSEGVVSFDDFFGSKSEGAGGEKGGEPGKDDLDQFHSWLQNLKR
jgi:hypothetical protein